MLLTTRFLSKQLQQEVEVKIFIPRNEKENDPTSLEFAKKYKVLYLLHGFSSSQHGWLDYTRVSNYAKKYNLALIIPDGLNSFFVDTIYGKKVYSFIVDELREKLTDIFPLLSNRKEDNFIAGLSMGGYGAIRIGMLNPDKYQAVASLSGALDIKEFYNPKINFNNFYHTEQQLGKLDDLENDDKDLMKLVDKKMKENSDFPKIFLACGKKDFVYYQTMNFKKTLDKHKITYTFLDDDGRHVWSFWDKHIKLFIESLNLDI